MEIVVSFTPQPLYSQGKGPQYALDRRVGGLQIQSGPCGEEKNLLFLPRIEPQMYSLQPVAIMTELSLLHI
jgi:hypothetical protein